MRDQLWACPQLRQTVETNEEDSSFWRALNAVSNLIDLPFRDQLEGDSVVRGGIHFESRVFHPEFLDCVASALAQDELTLPIYIIGLVEEESQAREKSWEILGFDLFDLQVYGEVFFRYVPLRYLVAHGLAAKGELDQRRPPAGDFLESVKELLDSAKKVSGAYRFLSEIQHLFGHGQRDRMQFYALERARNEVQSLRSRIESASQDLPSELLNNLLAQVDPRRIREENCIQDLRRIANADCQIIRLATLQLLDAGDDFCDRYDRVVVFEDCPEMREELAGWVHRLFPNAQLLLPDIANSQTALELRSRENEALLPDDLDGARILFCFDLEIGDSRETCGLPGGLWFLYYVALNYPNSSRVVVTGHRSLNQMAMVSGAAAVALKPLCFAEFKQTVECASPHSALWVVREAVIADWNRAADSAQIGGTFAEIAAQLRARLHKSAIELRDVSSLELSNELLAQADIVILDLWCEAPSEEVLGANPELDGLLAIIQRSRALQPDARILILVPNDDRCARHDGALRVLSNVLRDEDMIVLKPAWICGEHKTSLERHVRDAIASRPSFDIKYRVFTPMLGLVRPKAELAAESDLAYWAPLGVLLGDLQGFGVPRRTLAATRNYTGGWCKELQDGLRSRMPKEGEWWKRQYGLSDDENSVPEVVNRFADVISDDCGPLRRFSTIERWLRYVLDRDTPCDDSNDGGARSLTAPLRKLFGGETRYEFGARGGWYDSQGNYIPDAPLIFEFCAKRGIVGQEAIREVIVRYLREKGGEDVVLVEETPISGYLRC